MTGRTSAETGILPEAFLRTYSSHGEWADDEAEPALRGYATWFSSDSGEASRAIYVVQERLHESSLRWMFGAIFNKVRAIMKQSDPYGLLRAGLPTDEYEGEVSTILLRLEEARNAADATEIVREELTFSFGSPPTDELSKLSHMGEVIWRAWQR